MLPATAAPTWTKNAINFKYLFQKQHFQLASMQEHIYYKALSKCQPNTRSDSQTLDKFIIVISIIARGLMGQFAHVTQRHSTHTHSTHAFGEQSLRRNMPFKNIQQIGCEQLAIHRMHFLMLAKPSHTHGHTDTQTMWCRRDDSVWQRQHAHLFLYSCWSASLSLCACNDELWRIYLLTLIQFVCVAIDIYIYICICTMSIASLNTISLLHEYEVSGWQSHFGRPFRATARVEHLWVAHSPN